MDYPKSIEVEALELAHSQYEALAPIYSRIDDLVRGGHVIERKKQEYVKRRIVEDWELYQLRLEKFVYTNILGSAIRQQATKLEGGSLNLSGIPSRFEEFFARFREATDGHRRPERELISLIFRKAVEFGAVYALVEKPYSAVQPQNRLEEEQLGIDPYVAIFTPLEVINWSEGRNGLDWIKVRQLDQFTSPMGKTLDRLTFTIVDETHIVKYQHLVELDSHGKVQQLLDAKGEPISTFPGPIKFPLVRKVAHGRSRMPVIKLELPDDLWGGNQAYLKAIEHLNVENTWVDTATAAGYVQRLFTPVDPPEEKTSRVDQDPPQIFSDNAHILVGKGFSFNEIQGTSIEKISAALDKISREVRDIICVGGASVTKDALQQSGVSKSMDFVNEEQTLVSYGKLLAGFYQDILQQVAIAIGMTPAEQRSLSVTGLDSFSLDTFEGVLANAKELQALEYLISPKALELYYSNLQNLMNPNISSEQAEEIQKETEKIWANRFAFDTQARRQPNPDDVVEEEE